VPKYSAPHPAGSDTQRMTDYRFYACGRHEILNEAEKDRVHRDIGQWLTKILDR
jgi:alpha-beta hydrolase superfamily lysophospholipase